MPKRTDGNAVNVTVTGSALPKDKPVYFEGFHGFLMDDVDPAVDNQVAIDVAGQEWEFAVPAGTTAPKGTILYISTDGNHTISAASGAGKVPFALVTSAKDSNNIVWAKQLPQKMA